MAKTKISEFSAIPGNNTDIDGINIAEGCAPSGINDAIRELMSQLKDFQAGTAGDSFNGPVGTTTAAAGMFTTLSASGAVTLSGGTANGVAYLNGSKVLTSGSGLVFDGTNLGLGVTPSAWLASSRVLQLGNGAAIEGRSNSAQVLRMSANIYLDSAGASRYIGTGNAMLYEQFAGAHAFFTAPSGTAGNAISFTQAMTLDASGNLLVGTTSQPGGPAAKLVSVTTGTSSAGMFVTDTAGWQSIACWNKATSGTIYLIEFGTGASYAARGSITYNGTSVAYNTTSDYRLKENVKPMSGALAKVAALKPVTYTWKADGSEGEGFIAHELQEVCPNAVAGEKDAIDSEGNPKYQGIDTSFLVATLTAAIQEQQAIIEQLKADVQALKAV